MQPSTQVLLLTKDPIIQNLVEQVCLIDGHRAVTVATVEDALTARDGRNAFALVVTDTAALVACDQQQADREHPQWQGYAAYARLPLVFLGTMSPHSAFLDSRVEYGVFLEKPFGPHAFADMMRAFLTGQ